jgi:N-acetyl-alpha-D-muramate 1-phosphate uridylyltransferase
MKMNAQANYKSMPRLALLAGGLATRLRPITVKIPKSMVSVAGEPFVAHQLRLLARQGVHEVVMCAGYLGEQLQEFVGDGSDFGCHVEYCFDGEKLKGTGGAIKSALPLLGDHFFIMYGDSYLPTAFAPIYDAFLNSGLQGLMTVFKNDNQWDKSNVEFQEGNIIRYEKRTPTPDMNYIDYGLGIVNKEAFAAFNDDEVFDLALVYEDLVAKQQLAGYEVKERFFEIGSHEGLSETDALFLELQLGEKGFAAAKSPGGAGQRGERA